MRGAGRQASSNARPARVRQTPPMTPKCAHTGSNPSSLAQHGQRRWPPPQYSSALPINGGFCACVPCDLVAESAAEKYALSKRHYAAVRQLCEQSGPSCRLNAAACSQEGYVNAHTMPLRPCGPRPQGTPGIGERHRLGQARFVPTPRLRGHDAPRSRVSLALSTEQRASAGAVPARGSAVHRLLSNCAGAKELRTARALD